MSTCGTPRDSRKAFEESFPQFKALGAIRDREKWAPDPTFQRRFVQVKRGNKGRLAKIIRDTSQMQCDPDSLFDIHAKRIHAYKRQLLKVLHIIHEFLLLVEDARQPDAPRTYIFCQKGGARLLDSEANYQADSQRGPSITIRKPGTG